MTLLPIDSIFATCDETCPVCLGVQWVCENHPNTPWWPMVDGEQTCCGGAGAPCPGEIGLHA